MLPRRGVPPQQSRAAHLWAGHTKVVTKLRFKAHSILESFRYAVAGLYFMVRTQRNMRVHLSMALAVLALGYWVGMSTSDFIAIVLVSALVLICEMFNTAVENAVDLATHRRHPLAKAAKDVAAGAVLIAAITAALVGASILGPKVVERISGFNPWHW